MYEATERPKWNIVFQSHLLVFPGDFCAIRFSPELQEKPTFLNSSDSK